MKPLIYFHYWAAMSSDPARPARTGRPARPAKRSLAILFLLFCTVSFLSATTIYEAYRHYSSGRFGEAAAIFRSLHDQGELESSDLGLLGICYLHLDDIHAAQKIIDSAVQLSPRSYSTLIARGNLLLYRKAYEEAEEMFRKASETYPNRQESRNGVAAAAAGMAFSLMQKGEYEVAAEEAERAWTLQPRNAQLLALRIAALKQMGRSTELKEAYRSYLNLEPESAEAHTELGLLLYAEKQTEAALPHLQQAADLDSADPEPYLILARLAARNNKSDQARKIVKESVSKAVQLYNQYRLQAAGEFDKGASQDSEGLERIKELSRQAERPESILKESLDLLIALYDEKEPLLAELRRLSQWYPSSVDLRTVLAEQLTAAGRLEEAFGVWTSLAKNFPLYYRPHLGLGRYYIGEKKLSQAALSYRRALDLDSRRPEVYRGLQEVYEKMGKPEAYLQVLQMQLLKDAYNPLLCSEAAKAAEALNLKELAVTYRKRAEEIRSSWN